MMFSASEVANLKKLAAIPSADLSKLAAIPPTNLTKLAALPPARLSKLAALSSAEIGRLVKLAALPSAEIGRLVTLAGDFSLKELNRLNSLVAVMIAEGLTGEETVRPALWYDALRHALGVPRASRTSSRRRWLRTSPARLSDRTDPAGETTARDPAGRPGGNPTPDSTGRRAHPKPHRAIGEFERGVGSACTLAAQWL